MQTVSIIIFAALIIYLIISYVSRYKLRQQNEELKYKLELISNSMETENDMVRAKYRISHEEEKINTIKERLREKYGNRLVLEKKLLEEIVLYEKERAELMEVELRYEIGKYAEEIMLRFSMDENIAFFLNLIDNAVEAASLAEEHKQVILDIDRVIVVKNTYKNEKISLNPGSTSKDNKVMHGFGLGIIRQYCFEKKLSIEYTEEQGFMVTTIRMTA